MDLTAGAGAAADDAAGGDDRDPASVILPTINWTPACDDVIECLRPDDELLVVCDRDGDPVAAGGLPETARKTAASVSVLVAGEPDGCSGKANAVAHGMERATRDRFVWTDADFRRDDDWLDRLVAAGEEHGPATAIPFFCGGGWWLLWEAWTVVFSTLLFYLGVGSWGGNAWGGGVTFTREDLEVDALVADLRQVLSDDGQLSQHLDDVHAIRSMVTPVEVPGDFRNVLHRQIRFNRLTHVREGMYDALVVGTVFMGASIVFPLIMLFVTTGIAAVAYLVIGIRRPTFLLAFPGVVVILLGALFGIFCSECDWTGRRYRINGPRDVDIVEK